MTATTDTTVSVEPGGTVIDVLAVACGDSTIVERAADGSLIAFTERSDQDSIVMPTARVRLLLAHDRSRPVGCLDEWHVDDVGLHARGRLIGGAAKLDDLRELVAGGLMSDASVGFAANHEADQWSPPEQRRNGLPRVLRRQAQIREVSIVDQGAVSGSRVLGITAPRPGPSSSTRDALAEAESAVRGTGLVARQRVDRQAETALLWAETD